MERGCVEDQPQRLGHRQTLQIPGVLRLVEDDTAALRWAPVMMSPSLPGALN
jgi:hypothetical protein